MQIIPIASGKGGVGKSLLSANLAISLGKAGKKVLLVDLDLGASNLHLVIGQQAPKKGIGTFLTGCAVVRDEEKKKKALLLKSIYEKYGRKTVSLNQQAETAAIRNMLSDFKAAEVEEAVKTFDGLSDLLDELEKAQDDFDKATSVYRDAKLNKGTSASELKAEIVNIMNNELIGFLSSVYNNPTYSAFAKKVEDIVNKSNSLASQRNKKIKEPAAKETPASAE